MGHTFNRPDEAAMLRILERHPHSPEGAILRLAWLEGLSRSEITELRWDQVDFEGKAIQLPDRTVPLEPSTETCLRERHVRCALRDPHVVISERSKKPMPPESVSRLSRLALDSEGQKVNLMDLRHDFVIRQLQTHDWPCGPGQRHGGVHPAGCLLALSHQARRAGKSSGPAGRGGVSSLARDPAGGLVSRRTGSLDGLEAPDAARRDRLPHLGQVDFDQNLIRLPDRTVSMGSRLRRLLLDAWDRRKDPAEPRVFTAPTTGRPMDLSRLTTVTRTALIRGGLEHVNLRNLHTWVRQGDRAQLLMAQAEEQGWLTREAVMERLGVSKSTARQYLLELREAGRLVRVGTRYYPAGAVADPDDHLDIIRAYLQEHGTGRRQDFIRLLGLEPEQGTLLLRRLTDRGELVLTGRHYTLPEQEK